MTTLTRKQREIVERGQRVLEAARKMLLSDGYHGLSMDRIADRLEYSKGTIYNHFACKEEILLALMEQTAEQRLSLFGRAAVFRGGSRDRIWAVGVAAELFVRLYPEHFQVEQIVRSNSIWEKTSAERRAVVRSCEQRCVDLVGGVVRDAIASDDLHLPADSTPEDLVFGLWSLTHGAFSIIATTQTLPELGVHDPYPTVRRHLAKLLDGYAWRPLSDETDTETIRQHILDEVFPHESRRIQTP